ncbi:MAG TPA: hypothetical protein VGY54_24925 [Polyangiaceae bacterium]|jgi:hypothetical protein|nr:hypothetical protein [Polyangiaceae bacterium]
MVKLAWFILRAAFWLGLFSLFVPGFLPREATTASQVIVDERPERDTLTPVDRVASWREPRSRN